ncbi:MAG TPA: DinB family protein [Thermomicrobiales bacterium]|jgi:hypothetical protein
MDEIAAIEVPDASAEPQAYRATLLALVGERDPLDVIAGTPRRIGDLIQGRAPSDLERRPAGSEWSAAEILGHLLDVAFAMGFRWRMILTAERPAYPGYDEKAWAALPKPPIDQLWPALEAVRAYNLWLLRAIPRSAWSRVGLHSEVGPETLEATILAYAGHDLAHLNQLERCLG